MGIKRFTKIIAIVIALFLSTFFVGCNPNSSNKEIDAFPIMNYIQDTYTGYSIQKKDVTLIKEEERVEYIYHSIDTFYDLIQSEKYYIASDQKYHKARMNTEDTKLASLIEEDKEIIDLLLTAQFTDVQNGTYIGVMNSIPFEVKLENNQLILFYNQETLQFKTSCKVTFPTNFVDDTIITPPQVDPIRTELIDEFIQKMGTNFTINITGLGIYKKCGNLTYLKQGLTEKYLEEEENKQYVYISILGSWQKNFLSDSQDQKLLNPYNYVDEIKNNCRWENYDKATNTFIGILNYKNNLYDFSIKILADQAEIFFQMPIGPMKATIFSLGITEIVLPQNYKDNTIEEIF